MGAAWHSCQCTVAGYIQTEANEGEEMEKLSKQWVQDIPMARIAKPEQLRGAAVWLVSDASSYVTGSEIIVDGGIPSGRFAACENRELWLAVSWKMGKQDRGMNLMER